MTNDPQRRSDLGETRGDPGASSVDVHPRRDDDATKSSLIGSDRSRRTSNVSWRAIFAGVATFLALTIVLSMATAAMGLQGATGAATGIWSVVALAIALAVAGYVAGAMAGRGGLIHGFLAWAASVLALVVLAGWLGTTMLGAVGDMVQQVATQTNLNQQLQQAAQQGQLSQQEMQQAQQQLQQAARETAQGMWWAFAGTLIGGAIATLCGGVGARSFTSRDTEVTRRV